MLDRRAVQVVAGLAQPAALVVAQEVAAGQVRERHITAAAAAAVVAAVLLLNGEAKYEKSFD
jgi:hypothetical protein